MNARNHSAAGAKAATESLEKLRLKTARKRLAASRNQQDALEGLREIVGTMLGSEEIGLFTLDGQTKRFRVLWSFGIDLEGYDLRKSLGDSGHQRIMQGEYHVDLGARHHSGKGATIQAFVPISIHGRTVAVLAILRLLPQKNGFDKSDFQLFQLLTHEAGVALFGGNVPPNSRMSGRK